MSTHYTKILKWLHAYYYWQKLRPHFEVWTVFQWSSNRLQKKCCNFSRASAGWYGMTFPFSRVYFSEIGSYCINQVHTMIHYEILMQPHFYSSIIGDYGSRHFLAICYATSTYLLFRISSPFLVHIYYATYFLLYTKESVQEKK